MRPQIPLNDFLQLHTSSQRPLHLSGTGTLFQNIPHNEIIHFIYWSAYCWQSADVNALFSLVKLKKAKFDMDINILKCMGVLDPPLNIKNYINNQIKWTIYKWESTTGSNARASSRVESFPFMEGVPGCRCPARLGAVVLRSISFLYYFQTKCTGPSIEDSRRRPTSSFRGDGHRPTLSSLIPSLSGCLPNLGPSPWESGNIPGHVSGPYVQILLADYWD